MSTHALFSAALRDSDLPPPAPLTLSGGVVPVKRFAVYRNNVFVSLVDALAARFPAVRASVGEEFFAALARLYVGDNLPTSPVMLHYGESFPDFVATFPPLADFPWLGALAQLEVAWTKAYNAADIEPLGLDAFAQLTPDALTTTRLVLHPAVALVPSAHPIVTLWGMNTRRITPEEIEHWSPEAALISRPRLDVHVRALSPAGFAFFDALAQGSDIGAAMERAATIDAQFEAVHHLRLLATEGLVSRLETVQP